MKKKKENKDLDHGFPATLQEGVDGQLMVIAAFRYCLGRQSYIVGACIDWLDRNWDTFEWNTKAVILRDIVTALMDGEAGGKIDASGWKTFADRKYGDMMAGSRDLCEWLQNSVAYKKKPWPLDVY